MRLKKIIPYLLIAPFVLLAVGPFINLGLNSLKTPTEIANNPLGLPKNWQVENFANAIEQGNLANAVINSSIVVMGSVIGVLVISSLAAFGLARRPTRGAGMISLVILMLTAFPAHLFLVPVFALWREIGILDSHLGLMIVYWALYSPFATFLLRSFIISIPTEFDDAASIDGAGTFRLFTQVIIPMVWPGILTVALLVALWTWNEFLFANTLTLSEENRTVTVNLMQFTSRFYRDWAVTNAAAVLSTIPILILFVLLQRRFVEGLTQGGIRG